MLPAPVNDACTDAISLTVGAACQNGTTDAATTQGGEYLCISPGGGITPETVWYRFTASNDSLVLGFVQTNSTNCATVLALYGPFTSGGGCLPGAGNQLLCQNLGLIDPGFHPLFTGLNIGSDYLVQVQGNNCGGGNDRFSNFCISLNNPGANGSAIGASVINNCGMAFSGNTRGGYWNNGTSTGSNNLDNNAGTTITGASETGDDVTFVVNNCSWFAFCNLNPGTCSWSINLNNITGCLLTAPNNGVQAAIFTGLPSALTNLAISPNRIAPGSSWNSGSFNLATSTCAFIVVDGFAGDECNYDLTLTNISCPCLVLPMHLTYFSGRTFPEKILLNWAIENPPSGKFTIQRSDPGGGFHEIGWVDCLSPEEGEMEFEFEDSHPLNGWNHYRLGFQTNEGEEFSLNTVSVLNRKPGDWVMTIQTQDQELVLHLVATSSQWVIIQVRDLQGKIVSSQRIFVSEGIQELNIQLPNISAGIYSVDCIAPSQKLSGRFIQP